MLVEALGVFACIFILALVGMGPALRLVSSGEKRVVYALGIAPTLGLAMVGLIGFPLVRYVAPVRVWAWPFAAFWAVVSLAVVAWDWRRDRDAYRPLANGRAVLLVLAFVLVCYAVLVSPLIIGGIQYAIFRSNPSDAFLYMSLSETLRTVQWRTLIAGVDLSSNNIDGLRQLAAASPTALFAARHVVKPLPLNNVIALSWAAEMVNIPVQRFYYAYHLVCFALALPLALLVADRLRLPRGTNYLAAAAVVFGFWARFVLESDTSYQISTIPLFLLFVFAWVQLEQEPLQAVSRSRLFLAIAGAAVASFYLPLAPIVVVVFVLYYGMGLVQRVRPFASILYHGITLILIAAILSLLAQIDFLIGNLLYLFSGLDIEKQFTPHVLRLFFLDGVSALWGLPPSVILEPLGTVARVPLRTVADGFGVLLTGTLAITSAFVAKKSSPSPERIVFSVLVGGFVVALGLFALNTQRPAGRAFTYVYPYLVFGVVCYRKHMDSHLTPSQQRFSSALISAWLVLQCLLGLYLPNVQNPGGIFAQSAAAKPEQYDLSPIVEHLESHSPRLLLVNVPRTRHWTFPYYSMFVFSRYPSYFQSGIIIDNSTEFQNLWFEGLTAVPDYAVTLKSVDYIGPGNLGTKIAETADLALYQITTEDVTPFVEAEELLKSEEVAKSLFPTLKTD